jgi:hypothetical protein
VGEIRNAYKISNGKAERKREIGFTDMDWIHLVQYRAQYWSLLNTVMKLRAS